MCPNVLDMLPGLDGCPLKALDTFRAVSGAEKYNGPGKSIALGSA